MVGRAFLGGDESIGVAQRLERGNATPRRRVLAVQVEPGLVTPKFKAPLRAIPCGAGDASSPTKNGSAPWKLSPRKRCSRPGSSREKCPRTSRMPSLPSGFRRFRPPRASSACPAAARTASSLQAHRRPPLRARGPARRGPDSSYSAGEANPARCSCGSCERSGRRRRRAVRRRARRPRPGRVPRRFLETGEGFESISISVDPPAVSASLLKRLGLPLFWKPHPEIRGSLERLYAKVTERAMALAYGGRDRSTTTEEE